MSTKHPGLARASKTRLYETNEHEAIDSPRPRDHEAKMPHCKIYNPMTELDNLGRSSECDSSECDSSECDSSECDSSECDSSDASDPTFCWETLQRTTGGSDTVTLLLLRSFGVVWGL